MDFDFSINGLGNRIFKELILAHEGGYSNNANDKGGETMWGITIATARAAGYQGVMIAMPRDTAIKIYETEYWVKPKFDQVAAAGFPRLAYVLTDWGVNGGVARAARGLQDALNFLNRQGKRWPDLVEDGDIGLKTISTLRTAMTFAKDMENMIIMHLIAKRLAGMDDFADRDVRQEEFAFGWVRRCMDVMLLGLGKA